jgi:hypothetical protein
MRLFATNEKTDPYFFVMGMLFLLQAVGEYLLPGGAGGERMAIKLLCGLQVAFALATVAVSMHSVKIMHPIAIALILLCGWMGLAGMIHTDDHRAMLYACVMFFYWTSMFLFCYVRIQVAPDRSQKFLVLLALSLFIWILALRNTMALDMDITGRKKEDQIQNYLSYYMVALMPFVLLLDSKKLKTISLLLISFGAVYSLKRGAVLALLLMGTSVSLYYFGVLCAGKKRFRGIFISLSLWGFALAVGVTMYVINPDAVERRLNKDNSDRLAIYSTTTFELAKSTPFEMVFGHGYKTSTEDTGENPHNDWLLLQYDYGIVGVILMALVYITVLGLLAKLVKERSPLILPLSAAIMLMFAIQLYSMCVYIKTFGYITGLFGLVAGMVQVESQKRGWGPTNTMPAVAPIPRQFF